MCWNQHVSLNTFVFSIFVLILIAYNNKYTQYKTGGIFESNYAYFFFVSFIVMQLIEFFLWRNLKNRRMNNLFSIFGAIVVLVQPIASLLLLKDDALKYKLIVPYSIIAFIFIVQQINDHEFYTTVSKNGHLVWYWNYSNKFLYLLWILLLLFSIFMNGYYSLLVYTVFLILITYYTFDKDGTAGSLWCWVLNSVMIYYAANLLLYLPFKEHGICL